MERKPILTTPKQIIMVQSQPTIRDLLPDYAFQFQDEAPSEESNHMYLELLDFLSTNEELATMNINDKTEYSNGFKRAIAMVKLWMDSIYLTGSGGVDSGLSSEKNTHNNSQRGEISTKDFSQID